MTISKPYPVDRKNVASYDQEASLIKRVSPFAWQNINLCGRYEVRKGSEMINVNEIVQELAQASVQRLLAELF